MATVLKIENLEKSFTLHNLGKHIRACRHINIELQEGEFVGITGRSGSGKSTILKMIYRTYLPEQGLITYLSKAWGSLSLTHASERQMVYLRRHEIGYVSQFLSVIPRTTALELVAQAVVETGGSWDLAREEAKKMLTHFELDEELWGSYPSTFSGGEKLRLNIARAMVKKPRLLLLDEPTASLDQNSKQKVRQLIEQLKSAGTTMLGIFHDLQFMEGLCDKEYNMEAGAMGVSVHAH